MQTILSTMFIFKGYYWASFNSSVVRFKKVRFVFARPMPPRHCGLNCALGGSLGINITSFPLHCPLWTIQSDKHFSAYFQMLWNYLYPILTHFYWITSFWSLEYKRREIWENQVKNTAKLSYIWYLNCLKFWPNQ